MLHVSQGLSRTDLEHSIEGLYVSVSVILIFFRLEPHHMAKYRLLRGETIKV
jgi:hypothetical protein